MKIDAIIAARSGRINILVRLSSKAFEMFAYFLPCRKAPSMNRDTVIVVLPSMWSGIAMSSGMLKLAIDRIKPANIERIRGS
ncbi:MAG: hypothetical protein QXI48_07720 [Candidatus Bathyarchaeia archaeon]